MPIFGMNNGLVPILSYNYGAVKYDRIKKAVKLAMACAIAYMIVGLIVFQIMPDKLLMIFSVNSSVMSIGVAALKIISLSFLFCRCRNNRKYSFSGYRKSCTQSYNVCFKTACDNTSGSIFTFISWEC